jgi:hypothetical protein
MKEVKAYKSDDGYLSEDRRKVAEHEKEKALKDFFQQFVDKFGYNDMDKGDIADMLYTNRNELVGEIAKIESFHNTNSKRSSNA